MLHSNQVSTMRLLAINTRQFEENSNNNISCKLETRNLIFFMQIDIFICSPRFCFQIIFSANLGGWGRLD